MGVSYIHRESTERAVREVKDFIESTSDAAALAKTIAAKFKSMLTEGQLGTAKTFWTLLVEI